jgi:hypothetical protein
MRRFLFSRDFVRDTLTLFDECDWNFEEMLPAILDGSLKVPDNPNWRNRGDVAWASHGDPQLLLQNLATAFILKANAINNGPYGRLLDVRSLWEALQKDGFIYKDGQLREANNEVVDIQANTSALHVAINQAQHDNRQLLLHHLGEANRQFDNGEWGAATSEWRHFFEESVRGAWRQTRANNPTYSGRLVKPPFADVIKWLADSDFLTADEASAFGSAWGFLSVGTHPGTKPESLARLCRSLAMTFGEACLQKLAIWDGQTFGIP